MFEIQGAYASARTFVDELDSSAECQIKAMCDQPFVEGAEKQRKGYF